MVSRFRDVVHHVAAEVEPDLMGSEPVTSTPAGGPR
jgi:hypothetical protein